MRLEMKSETKITSIKEVTNTEHGSPYDRGSADAWYARPMSPHWYPKGTYMGKRVDASEMSEQEIAEYNYGYMTARPRPRSEFGGKSWD